MKTKKGVEKMFYDESFLELKIDFGRINLEFNKPLKRLDLEDLSDLISYYPISIQLIDITDEQRTDEKIVATLNGYYYDMDYIYQYGQGLFNTFDMVSGDTNKLYAILFDKDDDQIKIEYQTFSDNIFYLDRIYIENNYRNKGYATLLLSQLEDIIKYIVKLNVGIIIVCAMPFEKIANEEKFYRDNFDLKNKLIDLYRKTGFRAATDYNDYLIKIVDE